MLLISQIAPSYKISQVLERIGRCLPVVRMAQLSVDGANGMKGSLNRGRMGMRTMDILVGNEINVLVPAIAPNLIEKDMAIGDVRDRNHAVVVLIKGSDVGRGVLARIAGIETNADDWIEITFVLYFFFYLCRGKASLVAM